MIGHELHLPANRGMSSLRSSVCCYIQVVLSHTPFKHLLPSLEGPVMVAGMGNVAEVARHYGFNQILTPLDVAWAAPSIVPFWKGKAGKLWYCLCLPTVDTVAQSPT